VDDTVYHLTLSYPQNLPNVPFFFVLHQVCCTIRNVYVSLALLFLPRLLLTLPSVLLYVEDTGVFDFYFVLLCLVTGSTVMEDPHFGPSQLGNG